MNRLDFLLLSVSVHNIYIIWEETHLSFCCIPVASCTEQLQQHVSVITTGVSMTETWYNTRIQLLYAKTSLKYLCHAASNLQCTVLWMEIFYIVLHSTHFKAFPL